MEIKDFYKKSFLFKLLPSSYWWLPNMLLKELNGMRSILDLGCGPDSLLRLIPPEVYKEGIDIFPEYLTQSKAKNIHHKYRLLDIRNLDYPAKSFDAVIAIDVIEHLSKNEGLKLITDMERIARKKIIVCTTNGFLPQEAYNENEFQIHQSGWNVRELKELGFSVRGLYGWKRLRGERGSIKFRPIWLWEIISAITQKFVYRHPSLACQLFCVKITS